jgi:hypothetical protein
MAVSVLAHRTTVTDGGCNTPFIVDTANRP